MAESVEVTRIIFKAKKGAITPVSKTETTMVMPGRAQDGQRSNQAAQPQMRIMNVAGAVVMQRNLANLIPRSIEAHGLKGPGSVSRVPVGEAEVAFEVIVPKTAAAHVLEFDLPRAIRTGPGVLAQGPTQKFLLADIPE